MEAKPLPRAVSKDAELYNASFTKLMAMLLVVFCHSCSLYISGGWGPVAPARESVPLGLVASWLNTFHVYAFVAVSGYLFYYLKYEAKRYDQSARVIQKKALRLLLPYACASILWVIPFDIALWGFDAKRLFTDYALCMNPCQLWFLPMLFFVFCAFILLCRATDFSAQSKKTVALWLVALYAASLAANAAGSLGVPNVFQLRRAMSMLLFFYAGMQLRRADTSRLYRWKYILAAFALNVLLFAAGQLLTLSGAPAVVRLVLQPAASMAGVLWLVLLCGRIAPARGTENKFCKLLTASAFPIYLFHQQFIYLVILLMNRSGVAPYLLEETAFAVSLFASVGLSWILRRWRVTARMFGMQ